MSKTSTIRTALNGPLRALTSFNQFIVVKLMPSDKPGKFIKLPADYRDGQKADAHNPMIWLDAATACDAVDRLGEGYCLGYTFTENTGFFFLDIDNGLLPDNSDWSPFTKLLIAQFPGAAIEVSSSNKGLHIFGRAASMPHSMRNSEHHIELYTDLRFVALTGTSAVGDAGTDCTPALSQLITQYFGPKLTDAGLVAQWTTGPCAEWNGNTDDAQLLDRMLRSKSAQSAFSGKATFADLFDRNVEVLAKTYPDAERPYDESSADRALAQLLSFWTGKDCERIKRFMLMSKLVRAKWEREDYLIRTILSAVTDGRDVLTDKTPEAINIVEPYQDEDGHSAPESKLVVGEVYCDHATQINMFDKCVYIQSVDRVLIQGGILLKPSQFKVKYGGFSFTMDAENTKTTFDAYEAFTQSRALRHPKADSTCFKPDLPPATIVRDAGRTRANLWWPVKVPRKVGDATPFINHLKKLLPNERDREILMCYMAAIVQHKGVKFQWAPLLQGVEGNGKTILTSCVAEAVGARYTHMPPANEISEKFNSWLFGTIFIGVEDIYVPDQKTEIFEILKPMITSRTQARRAMNTDQEMQDVVCNFIFNSNHKDGLKKTRNDRRVCVLYTAQQQESDLARDGMNGAYFPNLYNWLRAEGFAIVNELLHTYPINDELNPATKMQRAPITSSTDEAIELGLGGVEQEIIEAIEQQRIGFKNGWVSSIYLDNLLAELGAGRRVARNKRRDMMRTLGYELHPGLDQGRVINDVLPDGGKPRLFVKVGSANMQIVGAKEIAAAYTQAQGLTFGVTK